MTAAPIADEVDDDVLVEGRPVLVGAVGGPGDRLGVVGVDVEDRHLQPLGQVGGVGGRAGGGRPGGEADLVVDDDVHGAAGAVGGQLAHIEGLVDHALPGEGGVAVHEHRHDHVAPRSYSSEEKDVVMCACSNKQMYMIKDEVRGVDPDAFMIVVESSEIMGEGFRKPLV